MFVAQQARLHAQDTSLEALRETVCSSEAARKVFQCKFCIAQADLATPRGILKEEAAQYSKHHQHLVSSNGCNVIEARIAFQQGTGRHQLICHMSEAKLCNLAAAH